MGLTPGSVATALPALADLRHWQSLHQDRALMASKGRYQAASLQTELLRLCRKLNKTVLFVTHDVDEALLLSDHIQVMSQAPGRLIRHYHLTQERPRALSRSGNELLEIRDEILGLLHPKTMLSDAL